MHALLARLPCSALLAIAFLGCSGGISNVSTDGDGGGADATTTDASPTSTDAGLDAAKDAANDAAAPGIWPADAETLSADSAGGGFTPTPPAGSKCSYGAEHYTLQIKTSLFTFARCAAGATPADPLQLVQGSRTLATAELASVDTAMKAVTLAKDGTACGADKGVYTVSVKTPAGETIYYDSFYACQGGGKIYVDNIDAPFQALRQLAPIK
jgi:hypothetical protein